MFQRLVIVGPGLIGASFGLAIKKLGLAREIIGVARSQETQNGAVQIGACDFATSDLIEAATGADFVFLAPPVGQMKLICQQIAPVIGRGALITDAGSTKAQVVRDCEAIFGQGARFIGGHPMAGSEKVGPLAARGDLFRDATWILTPTSQSNSAALEQMQKMVTSFGAKPLILDAQTHDELLAITSHLPHLTAAALTQVFGSARAKNEVASQLVAGGWRDGTRVAAGSAEMWRDICLANRDAILSALENLSLELNHLRLALSESNGDSLLDWLQSAATERRKF
ncbi:prephenate dehydrogenase [Abditibacterium utsteinense]|uniref:Prephenate dehydrogenase n=1 Tax=Abditibacterium utsteinense TaxID=1960156 RepID=A0A2S8SRP8_9BACT|nr:prephenate dehydrogenase/arogenate dehydrogenase family protein [Abditibacterium utsteinense]PQV63492.1 prephenate dehydrogenase [Abditibacterium utsteinense]